MFTTDLDLTMSSGGMQPGKEDSSHYVGMAEGLGDYVPNTQNCIPTI